MITAPWWLRWFYPNCVWDIKTSEKIIYLTFDDGPHPEITPFVLDVLNEYNAKATFFCIGDNVRKFPQTYQQVIDEGHAVGNHTMHHLNGWKHKDDVYLADIEDAARLIETDLFRPPYGRAKKSQLRKLKAANFNMQPVLWSVLAGDWIATLHPEKCFQQVKQNIYPGCIVVFHDSEKANERMRYALPRLLEYASKEGYHFEKIEKKRL
ncbi:MAG: polysaccharide deacetylase family protein [Bacteroidetes bacterium]|nr:polysaccharide deacetylase family protein [Bacteroidota bacterium]